MKPTFFSFYIMGHDILSSIGIDKSVQQTAAEVGCLESDYKKNDFGNLFWKYNVTNPMGYRSDTSKGMLIASWKNMASVIWAKIGEISCYLWEELGKGTCR